MQLVVPDRDEASAYWKVPLLLDKGVDRVALAAAMSEAGVAVDWAYQPALHLQPVFQELFGTAEGLLPRSEDLLSRHLCLPCHQRMTVEDAEYVSSALKASLTELYGNGSV